MLTWLCLALEAVKTKMIYVSVNRTNSAAHELNKETALIKVLVKFKEITYFVSKSKSHFRTQIRFQAA